MQKQIQNQLIDIDKEQHLQNMDMMDLLRVNNEQDRALLYVVQQIVEKEKVTIPYMGPMGEA
jgi:hypothetical protein